MGIDKVVLQFQEEARGDLVVSFPYKDEGEIEKVSYTIDNGYLNIIVKSGEQGLSFSEQDVSMGMVRRYTPGLLITVGTPRLGDLDRIYNPETA